MNTESHKAAGHTGLVGGVDGNAAVQQEGQYRRIARTHRVEADILAVGIRQVDLRSSLFQRALTSDTETDERPKEKACLQKNAGRLEVTRARSKHQRSVACTYGHISDSINPQKINRKTTSVA